MKRNPVKRNNQKKDSPFPVIPKWALAGILLLTAIVYARAVFCDFVGYDDNVYIRDNVLMRDFSWNGIWVIFRDIFFTLYHPLTVLSYWIEYNLFGDGPVIYHLTNVILHVLNTLLAFKLAEGLSGKKVVGVMVAMLFALHPMHVESVAWVSERKDVLYSFFFLLALVHYVRYLKSGFVFRIYMWMALAFIASLLSKPSAVTLPVVLVAIDWYMGRTFDRKAIVEKIPLFLLSLLFGLVASSQQGDITEYLLAYSPFDRVLLATHNLSFYVIKLFVPVNLSPIYYYPVEEFGKLTWGYYASLPFLLAITYLLYRWIGFRKEVLFGTAFFLITISVMLQIFPFGRAIRCDRYTYIPYIGLFYLFAQWMADAILPRWKKSAMILFLGVMAVFSILTVVRIGVWRNPETVLTDVIKNSPRMAHSYAVRGMFRSEMGNTRGAIIDFNKALELEEDHPDIYAERGRMRGKLGDMEGSLSDLDISIQMDSTNANAFMNRSIARVNSGNPQGALADLNRAIELTPVWPEAFNSRAYVRGLLEDYAGAAEDYNKFLQMNPYDTAAYTNLGVVQLHLADSSKACEAFENGARLGGLSSQKMAIRFCR